MSETIYFNSLRGKKANYGIKLSGKATDLIAEIQKHTNSKGFINLELKERKQPDNYGNTHYAVVDTYEPKEARNEAANDNNRHIPKDDLPF
jgi:hypothetical protein